MKTSEWRPLPPTHFPTWAVGFQKMWGKGEKGKETEWAALKPGRIMAEIWREERGRVVRGSPITIFADQLPPNPPPEGFPEEAGTISFEAMAADEWPPEGSVRAG